MSIAIRHISKQFGAFRALDDVSIDIPSGELVALLGPSGCGKTTLLRIIAGLDYADGGQILLDGDDASARPIRERQVGFVFQHYALFRHMSIFENVAFGLRVKPRRLRPAEEEIRRRVLDDGVTLPTVAKKFADVVFPIDAASKKARDAAGLKNVATRLKELLAETRAVPRRLADEVSESLERLLAELEEKDERAA